MDDKLLELKRGIKNNDLEAASKFFHNIRKCREPEDLPTYKLKIADNLWSGSIIGYELKTRFAKKSLYLKFDLTSDYKLYITVRAYIPNQRLAVGIQKDNHWVFLTKSREVMDHYNIPGQPTAYVAPTELLLFVADWAEKTLSDSLTKKIAKALLIRKAGMSMSVIESRYQVIHEEQERILKLAHEYLGND